MIKSKYYSFSLERMGVRGSQFSSFLSSLEQIIKIHKEMAHKGGYLSGKIDFMRVVAGKDEFSPIFQAKIDYKETDDKK